MVRVRGDRARLHLVPERPGPAHPEVGPVVRERHAAVCVAAAPRVALGKIGALPAPHHRRQRLRLGTEWDAHGVGPRGAAARAAVSPPGPTVRLSRVPRHRPGAGPLRDHDVRLIARPSCVVAKGARLPGRELRGRGVHGGLPDVRRPPRRALPHLRPDDCDGRSLERAAPLRGPLAPGPMHPSPARLDVRRRGLLARLEGPARRLRDHDGGSGDDHRPQARPEASRAGSRCRGGKRARGVLPGVELCSLRVPLERGVRESHVRVDDRID